MPNCKYCTFESNGDFPDDHKEIIDRQPLKIEVSKHIKENGGLLNVSLVCNPSIYLDVGVDQRSNIYAYAYSDNMNLDVVLKGKINYCPMCGRKLSD